MESTSLLRKQFEYLDEWITNSNNNFHHHRLAWWHTLLIVDHVDKRWFEKEGKFDQYWSMFRQLTNKIVFTGLEAIVSLFISKKTSLIMGTPLIISSVLNIFNLSRKNLVNFRISFITKWLYLARRVKCAQYW